MTGPRALVIEVRFPGGRFHGARRTDRAGTSDNSVSVEEWPPSPFRLFQALVAGAYGGRWAAEGAEAKDAAFAWLEALDAPVVVAPPAHALAPVTYFVPNNDLDAMGGDPSRVNEIRVSKRLRTAVIGGDKPVVYAWTFAGPTSHAELLLTFARRLHTLGLGIDQAFASAALLDEAQLQRLFEAHGGAVHRPGPAGAAGMDGTPCPVRGSLASLKARHEGSRQRFRRVVDGRKSVIEFRQPARAHARMVVYGAAPDRLLFDLRDAARTAEFRPTPQTAAATLVKAVRDLAFDRLTDALPERREPLERAIVGRGDPAPDPCMRLRFIPLPSIGLVHTSPSIRRLLVEVPPGSPVTVAELRWALAGRVFGGQADADGVLTGQTLLAPASDDRMAGRYAAESSVWRSVTPVVLPQLRPVHAASGGDRVEQLNDAAKAVTQALRHAAIEARAVSVRVQREPFRERGRRVEDHDADRFGTARLHHLELRLDRAVNGPLVLGDGRWLGLGVMEPVKESPAERHVFRIERQGPPAARAFDVSRALRRAVMSLVQATIGGKRTLPSFFSGHEPDGKPAADKGHQHLFYLADDADGDGRLDRLAIVAPPLLAALTVATKRERHRNLETLLLALRRLNNLRAGPDGLLRLCPVQPDGVDPLFGVGRTWTSRTPYRPTRQPKRELEDALVGDLRLECARRGLPAPQSVEILGVVTGLRGRVSARARLHFATAIAGPLLLGDGAHFGRSLFGLDDATNAGHGPAAGA